MISLRPILFLASVVICVLAVGAQPGPPSPSSGPSNARLFLTCGSCKNIMKQPGMVFIAPTNASYSISDAISAHVDAFCPEVLWGWGVSSFPEALFYMDDDSRLLRENDIICDTNAPPSSVTSTKKKSVHHHKLKKHSSKNRMTTTPIPFPTDRPQRLGAWCSPMSPSVVISLYMTESLLVSDVLTEVNLGCGEAGTGLQLTGAGSFSGGALAVPLNITLPLGGLAQDFILDGDSVKLI